MQKICPKITQKSLLALKIWRTSSKNDQKIAMFFMHLNCHPEYQLQTQFASYLIMIVTIILTLETGMRGECDIEWFNMMSIVMATGFVASDLEHMYMLACTVKTRDKLYKNRSSRKTDSQ